MMLAGDYSTRFAWGKKTKDSTDGPGQRRYVYPGQGHLWGALEDVAVNRETVTGSERQVVTATVRVRNYPALAPGDRLEGGGRVWEVKTAVEGDNETICEVEC